MTDFFKSIPPAIWAALISLLGAAVLAPAANRLLSFIFERKSKVEVSILGSDIQPSTFIAQAMKYAYKDGLGREEENLRDVFGRMRGYIRATVTNRSTSTIKNLSLSVEGTLLRGVVQIGPEGQCSFFDGSIDLSLGDVQPRKFIQCHIYQTSTAADYNIDVFKQMIQVTADHLDRVSYKFETAKYIEGISKKKRHSILNYALTMIFLAASIYAVYFSIFGYRNPLPYPLP